MFFPLASFRIFSLSLIMCNLKIICLCVNLLYNLFCLIFSEFPGYVFCCLILIWGNSQLLLIQIFLLFLFFSFWNFSYAHVIHFVVVPLSLNILLFCLLVSVFVLLCFLDFEDSVAICCSSEILSLTIFSLLISASNVFIISVTVYFIFNISLWLFLRISICMLTIHFCYCMLFTLIFRAHSILNIVALNSQTDTSNIFAMSGFDVCFVSSKIFLSFGMLYNFFLESQTWCRGIPQRYCGFGSRSML